MRYVDIVFMQGDEGRDVIEKLCNVEGVVAHGPTAESITETIEYLQQWENDEDEIIREDIITDEYVEEGDYLLTWNLGLGYVGLSRKV